MRNCFVTGCDSYCKQHNMIQRKMFLAPKDMVEKWSALVRNNKRPLNKSDRVCERHFNENDIIEFWESNINGRIHLTPRDKPKLRDSVVPCRNLSPIAKHKNPPAGTLQQTQKKRKAAAAVKEVDDSIREDKILKLIDDISDDITSVQLDVDIPQDTERLYQQSPTIDKTPETTNKLQELYESAIQPIELSEDEKSKNLAIFETLYEEAFDVELPNLLWGIHRDPERKFIAFSEFNQQLMNVWKVLIVSEHLMYEQKISGVVKVQDYIKLQKKSIIEELSTMLDEFEKNYV